jgi:hypothetical protein
MTRLALQGENIFAVLKLSGNQWFPPLHCRLFMYGTSRPPLEYYVQNTRSTLQNSEELLQFPFICRSVQMDRLRYT